MREDADATATSLAASPGAPASGGLTAAGLPSGLRRLDPEPVHLDLSGHGHAHGGGAPEEGLVIPGDSVVHRLPAQVKVVALVALAMVVVATPAGGWPVLAADALLLAGVVALARLPWGHVLRRLLVEAPFVAFALVTPLVATGPRVDVLGLSLSRAGLLAGGTLLAKATLGVLAAVVLASTTSPREIVAGLDRLRLPATFVAILSFMVRYLAVVTGDLHRMRVARESRGYVGGRAGHLVAVAGGAGALFVRSYERGERVHQAMLARGYTGRLPSASSARVATAGEWLHGLALPAAAAIPLLTWTVLR
ncbi:cobalt ECF transporter T component CbiQ [Arsenicicoccus dermatophilus]|uniref:cobalt ECF transporter T component CbiQ n=1 Tax=Arsenicicoccus dermatophilus TaxID=1076331 RepID=UPI001F4CC047|nr:cobalt ECF transporter T component CbiQ [Arsenicicoccus dermatophilus]MCH8611669.1 cobalt ECF transporter T component CbiQ [Arsenicicoccus dermatophilus]